MSPRGAADRATRIASLPFWSTSTFGETGNALAKEFSGLGEHLDLCRLMRGRLFTVRCGADIVRGFLAARFVTAVVLAAALLAVIVALAV